MAALMRSARFCSPAVQITKFLRVASSGTSQSAAGLFTRERPSFEQRCWRSTAVEGAQAAPPAPNKLEVMMNTIERYVRQFGRISRKQLDPVVQCFDKEGSISLSHSLTLLRLYGTTLFDEPPANRLKMAEQLWETYKKHGIPLDVMHYNTLLAVYNMNKLNFSPTDFLANMEANGIAPNRITYQRLIARFCEDGDIPGATQVLEHMKAASLPINDHVFNSFITGHLRANDPDNARNIVEVMRQTGLDPTNMTYTVMAMGFAQRGEIDEVKKYISQAEIENVPLRPGQFLDVYVTLAVSGHSDKLSELFPFLHSGTPFNQDAIRVCNQLIAAGHDDAAYTLFLQMPKPSRLDADQTTLGRFFLRALARHHRPVEKVVEVVKDMQKREVNKDDLSAVAHLAYLESQPAYALSVLEKMKEEGLAVRAHYFWPAICQFRDDRDMEGVYGVMERMGKLCDTRDDFIQTLHSYTIPALEALGQTQEQIIDNLKTRDFKAEDIHFALFLSLLENFKLKEALAFLESHTVSVHMGPVRACALSLTGRDMDWRVMLQIMSQLRQQSGVWRGPAMEATAIVLKQILTTQRKADWADVHDIFTFMKDNNLRILKRSQTEMSEYYGGAPAEVLQGLKDLVTTDKAASTSEGYSGDLVSSETSLEELKQLAKDRPDNKTVLKRLLIKACSVGDVEEAERVHGVLEGVGFVFPPIMLAQMAYLYAAFVKDLGKASAYLQQLEDTFPEHQNYQTVVLKMAALLAASGNTEAAVERLKKFAERHASVVETQEVRREENYSDILRCAADRQAAKQLMTAMTTWGYLPASSPLLLNSYMDKVLDSGDSECILQEFEEILKTHKYSPQVDKVLQFFINKEDPDSLQKVVDLLTEVHGLMNVLHHLIADFIQCGHVKKARKIMETPGLRANMQRLNYYCQNFIEKNMIKELEMLVEVTKDMFAVDRDNMLFHLMRGYVKRKELDKAQDVLLQYEEEMLQPSARTLRYMARSLEAAGLPVPFDVPDFQAPVGRTERRQARSKGETAGAAAGAAAAATVAAASKTTAAGKSAPQPSPAASQLKDMLTKGEVQQALTTLESDKSVLSQAIALMKKPWPSEALQSVFKSLAEQGDLDTLTSMEEGRLPMGLRNSLKTHIFTAAVNSGRGEEVIDRMEVATNSSARYLTMEGLEHLNTSAPHLMDRLENVLRKLKTEKNYTEPLSILWCYYKYSNSPRAEQIIKEVPGFDKAVLAGTLSQAAVRDNKAEVLESLLQLKQGAGEKRGMAVAYSGLLQLHVAQDDVQAVQKTCERIVADNFLRSELRTNAVRKTEEFLQHKSQPAPAWGAEDSSSSSDSSSSDDEKPAQRS